MRREPIVDPSSDLITRTAEGRQALIVWTSDGRRIVDLPEQSVSADGPDSGAVLFGMRAHRNEVVDMHLAEIFVYILAAETIYRHPRFLQNGDGLGTNLGWLESSAVHLESITSPLTQNRFRHLASSGIAGTKEEHAWKMHRLVPPSPPG
jgi:hypothetical protein